jgi:protoheme IX farnesyltransferase
MLFLWQIPHFLALAWLYRDDYEKGGFRVLPVIDRTGILTASLAVLYSLASIPLAIASVHAGMGGRIFLAGSLALGAGLMLIGIRLMRHRTEARARALFVASIVYLPILLGLLLADQGRGTFSLFQ